MTRFSNRYRIFSTFCVLLAVYPLHSALAENNMAGLRDLAVVAADSGMPATPRCENVIATNDASVALPEAPQVALTTIGNLSSGSQRSSTAVSFKLQKTVAVSAISPRLSASDKVLLGFRDLGSPVSVAGVLIGAGYSHLNNGQPNYGVDGDAFAQRFGAGMARSASQTIFTTSVMAPILREDPRYYVLGPDAKLMRRVLYVVTRPFVTRTDGGHQTVNASLLLGYAGAAALTRTYYPQINRNATDEARTFGSSIGGAAAGFAFDEFSGQLLKALRHKH